jgi:hypothetical protein
MNKGTKTAIAIGGVVVLTFLAYKFSKAAKPSIGGLPPIDVMREELWQSFVTKYPETAASKSSYIKSDAFNNVDFLIAWYRAKNSGQPTFEFNSKTWRTDDGMGV